MLPSTEPAAQVVGFTGGLRTGCTRRTEGDFCVCGTTCAAGERAAHRRRHVDRRPGAGTQTPRVEPHRARADEAFRLRRGPKEGAFAVTIGNDAGRPWCTRNGCWRQSITSCSLGPGGLWLTPAEPVKNPSRHHGRDHSEYGSRPSRSRMRSRLSGPTT